MPAKTPTRKSVVIRRVVLIALSTFCAWHIFATFLWIAPPSGLRQAVPGNLLQRYMIPMFGQSWSVFAPAPINGDYRLQVRAVVNDTGTPQTTKWVDATAADLAMEHHNLFPPRAAIQSTELSSRYKNAYDKLNADHLKIVQLGYYKGADWDQRLAAKMKSYGSPDLVDAYMREERTVDAYATQVAYAAFGNNVVQVQFVVSRQNVVPYSQRNDPHAQRPPVQVALTGWRGALEQPGQSREDFRKVFRRGLQESGQ